MKTVKQGLALLVLLMLIAAMGVGTAAAEINEDDFTVSLDPKDYDWPVLPVTLGLQESERVDGSYFDDVVFIGDSISLKLSKYAKKLRQDGIPCLGQAQFLVAGSLGVFEALSPLSDKSVHPSYQGEKIRVEDGVALCGAKKVYIMLGMNDVALDGTQEVVAAMEQLVDLILEKSPDVEIFFQSATPRISTMTTRPTNQQLFALDLKLYEACLEHGWYYVDVASVMRDKYGYLPLEYCSDASDMGLHFNDEGCAVWVDFLETHVKEEFE